VADSGVILFAPGLYRKNIVGAIYASKGVFANDGAKTAQLMAAFSHEIQHLWTGTHRFAPSNANVTENDKYHVNLIPGKSFLYYGDEQQAQLMQGLFLNSMFTSSYDFHGPMNTTGRQAIGYHATTVRHAGEASPYADVFY